MTDPLSQQETDHEKSIVANARHNEWTLKSCLKNQVLRDTSIPQQGLDVPKKTKQVKFVVEKPDRPSTLTKNRLRQLSFRTTMQPLVTIEEKRPVPIERASSINKEDRHPKVLQLIESGAERKDNHPTIIKLIEDLGDANRTAFFHGIKRLLCGIEPILATFQAGVTKEFLEYFWSIKWSEDELTEDEKDDYEEFKKFEIKFLAGAAQLPELPPPEPTFVILFNPPVDHQYLMTLIANFCEYDSPHRIMIVGDLSLMLDLSSQTIWDSVTLLYYTITMHDKARSSLFADLSEEHLEQSAGIPSLVLHLLREKSAPKFNEPAFFWQAFPKNHRVRALAMKVFVLQDTRAPINSDCKYEGINMTHLARCCGCLMVDVRGTNSETPNSSVLAVETTKQRDYTAKIAFWPTALIKTFTEDHTKYVGELEPKSTEVGWLLLEQITTQNMAKHHTEAAQTLGQRFTFLTASFIADIKHEVNADYVIMPQVKVNAKPLLTLDAMSFDDISKVSTVNKNDFWYFVKNVLPPNQPFVCRNKGATPDWMVKLVDGDKQHLLCIQLKSGTTEYSIWKVLDEMAQSPGVDVQAKDYAYRDIIFREAEEHGIKLTFVYGAISHATIKKQLCALGKKYLAKGSSSRFGALRITHESYNTTVPNNVEVIILLKTGLKNLLGKSNYKFVKWYNANAMLENRVTKALDASFSDNTGSQVKDVLNESQLDPRSLSSTEVKDKLLKQWNSMTEPFNKYFTITWGSDGTLHVTPKKAHVPESEVPKTNTSPSHTMSNTSHPASPISASEKGNASESESESSVRSTRQQGTVRRERENDEETAAEHVSKKYKNDEDTRTAPIAGDLSKINNQETADE